MRVTSKGQVTIPQAIREKLGINPNSDVEFVEERGKVVLRPLPNGKGSKGRYSLLRGVGTVKMTTAEILALTRR